MKRYRILLLALVSLLGIACANCCSALDGLSDVYTFPRVNRSNLDQFELFRMQQGYFQNDLVWFVTTDTDDLKTAFDSYKNASIYYCGITYAPKLINAVGSVATMYIVLNNQQGPVFTDVPGGATYSGLWQVIFVQFKPGVSKHTIKNTDPYDPITNPTGLPSPADADYFTTAVNGTPIILKAPIVAVGPLGGPWYPAPAGQYRIAQAKADYDYAYRKDIWLPYWRVYCTDQVSKRVMVRRVIIPDVLDPVTVPVEYQLAAKIGANKAPGLALIPQTAESTFYFLTGIGPVNQYPVIDACPSDPYQACRNANTNYSPVMKEVALGRYNVPTSSVFNNVSVIQNMLSKPPLSPHLFIYGDTQVINAPVIPELSQNP